MNNVYAIGILICAVLACCGLGCASHPVTNVDVTRSLVGIWERTDPNTEWGPAITRFIFRGDGVVVNEVELISNKTVLNRRWEYTADDGRIISRAWGERPIAYRVRNDELILFLQDNQPTQFHRVRPAMGS